MFVLVLMGIWVSAVATPCIVTDRYRATRPELVAEQQHETADGLFLIHYTSVGSDAVEDEDEDEDGIPDVVIVVEEGLATTWAHYVEGEGWREPGTDFGRGGDDRIDIYIREIDANGYAYSEAGEPFSSGFIELDPDLTDDMLMRSVAGHELHHLLEFAYRTDGDTWMYEASATWAQYLLFDSPLLTAGRESLFLIRLGSLEEGMDAVGNRYEYSAFVFVKFLVEWSGDPLVLRSWWEQAAEGSNWETALDDALAGAGLIELASAFRDHMEWNYFACGRDDGLHYDSVTGCKTPTFLWQPHEVREAQSCPCEFEGELQGQDWASRLLLVEDVEARTLMRVSCLVRRRANASVVALATAWDGTLEARVDGEPDAGVIDLEIEVPAGGSLALALGIMDGADDDYDCDVIPVVLEPVGCGCRASDSGAIGWIAVWLLIAVRKPSLFPAQ